MRRNSATLTTDSYTIQVINPRRKGLRPLLDDDGKLTDDGNYVMQIIGSMGYDTEVRVDGE